MLVSGGSIRRGVLTLLKTVETAGKAAAMNVMIAVRSTALKIAPTDAKADEMKASPFVPAAPGSGTAADTGQRVPLRPPSIMTGMRAIITAMAPTALACGLWFDKVPPLAARAPSISKSVAKTRPDGSVTIRAQQNAPESIHLSRVPYSAPGALPSARC